MSFFDKAKNLASGYKDNETGKTGVSGLAAQGQETLKDYKADAADGQVDWKKQATGLFGDLKGEVGGAKKAGAAAPATNAAAQPPAQPPAQ